MGLRFNSDLFYRALNYCCRTETSLQIVVWSITAHRAEDRAAVLVNHDLKISVTKWREVTPAGCFWAQKHAKRQVSHLHPLLQTLPSLTWRVFFHFHFWWNACWTVGGGGIWVREQSSLTSFILTTAFSKCLNFLPCRPHLSPLSAGQGVSIQHPPQHSPSNGGVNPQQPEAMVVVLYFIYDPLSERPSHRFCVQRGAVDRPSFLQSHLLVLQSTQWLLHLGVVPSPPRGVYPPDTREVLCSCDCPLGAGCDCRVWWRGGPQKKCTIEPMWVQVLRGAHRAIW